LNLHNKTKQKMLQLQFFNGFAFSMFIFYNLTPNGIANIAKIVFNFFCVLVIADPVIIIIYHHSKSKIQSAYRYQFLVSKF